MNAFEPILAWAVIEPCGKLALFSIAATPDQAKEFFLGSDETEGWNALETVGVHVVAITIKSSQGNKSTISAAAERVTCIPSDQIFEPATHVTER
jgi:hypothetical protein